MNRSTPLAAALLAGCCVTAVLAAAPPASAVTTSTMAAQIAAGDRFTVLLDSTGHLYGAGGNADGELTGTAPGPDTLTSLSTTGLPDGVTVTTLLAASYETIALGSDGQVYGVGADEGGVLSTGTDAAVTSFSPMLGLPGGVTAVQVAAEDAHTLVLGSDGVVYGSGWDPYGQLAGVDDGASIVPTLLPLPALPDPTTPVMVGAGWKESFAVGANGDLYGTGDLGQFGGEVSTWEELGALPAGVTPTSITVGDHDAVILGSDGVAYGWGSNTDAQMTTQNGEMNVEPLEGLPAGVTAKAVSAAPESDFTAVLGSDGQVYVTGTENPAVGPTDFTSTWQSLHAVTGPAGSAPFVAVTAGGSRITAVSANGSVWGIGANSYGQLTGTDVSYAPGWHLLSGLAVSSTALPTVTGTARVGQVLTAHTGSWTLGADTFTYRWARDGVAVTSATAATYTVGSADVGHHLSVTVTASRTGQTAASATSTATAAVALGSALTWPSSHKPTISGTRSYGHTLHLSGSTLTGWSPDATSLTYTWRRGSTTVSHSSSYKVHSADRGHTLHVIVTAHRTGYAAGSLTTASVSISR